VWKGYPAPEFTVELNQAISQAKVCIEHEVDRLQRVGHHSFAPNLLQWNIEEGWYEEEYVNGYKAERINWKRFLGDFHDFVAPLVSQMILASPPCVTSALEYAHEQRCLLQQEEGILGDMQPNADKVNLVEQFVDSIIGQLQREGDRQILLVLSHGDFSPGHVLITKRGSVIIDWEGLGTRSALHDLYEFFFQRVWKGYPAPEFTVELNQAISQVQARLAQNISSDNHDLSHLESTARTYRLVYYIERVIKGISKGERFINIFNSYEQNLFVRRTLHS